jgi:regulatory protein
MEVRQAIMRYCEYQERCHSEVRNKLYELGCTTPEVEQEITRLIEDGLLNEERFARAYARGKFRLKYWGRVKIRQQLKLKKISDYCIKKAMTEIDGDEYEARMEQLMRRKAIEINRTEHNYIARKAKLYRYMLGKGYEQDMIYLMYTHITKGE